MTFAVHEEFDESLVKTLEIPESMIVRGYDVNSFLDLYSDADNSVLAMRLHAGMLALANGLPAVFVGHDTRTYAFCELAGLSWVELFAAGAARETVDRVRRVMSGEVSEFAEVRARFPHLREAMSRFMQANDIPTRAQAVVEASG
jgi:polysaccharide pyruvyl transferase WcaK-like protein